MVKVKICGITNLEDALIAQKAGADILGFVFAQSPRRIEPDAAKKIIEKLTQDIKIAALFVNEQAKVVGDIVDELGRVDLLQFHGDEPPQYCKRFRGRNIIKAFRIKDEASLERIPIFKGIGFVLLDAFRESHYGGTGKAFDWGLALRAKAYGIPIILSGGLNPDNVKEAILKVKPYCVDVSSGVEKSAGKKDKALLERFIEIAKSV